NGREGLAVLAGGQCVRWTIEHGSGELVESTWHPQFGVSQPCSLLRIRLAQLCGRVRFSWR
ncbi:MAG: hypothetical protein KDA51_09050, partial [Planctomycetales bacterium]|nr:hypothetical protein [Planctomycetales bacterium]